MVLAGLLVGVTHVSHQGPHTHPPSPPHPLAMHTPCPHNVQTVSKALQAGGVGNCIALLSVIWAVTTPHPCSEAGMKS